MSHPIPDVPYSDLRSLGLQLELPFFLIENLRFFAILFVLFIGSMQQEPSSVLSG